MDLRMFSGGTVRHRCSSNRAMCAWPNTCPPRHRRAPPTRQTLESKAHVPAIVTVRVPKDFFPSATQSGNHHLVQRTVLQAVDKRGPLTAAEALQRTGIKPRVPVHGPGAAAAAAAEERSFKEAMHFESEQANSFPPRYLSWEQGRSLGVTPCSSAPAMQSPCA